MYKPYPIFDMRYGKTTEREPWLSPKDGFGTLRNGHLRKGVLEKRRGYSLFGQIVHVNTGTKAPTLKTDPVMGIFNYYSGATEQLMAMDKKRINKYLTEDLRSTGKTITAFADAGGGEVQATCTHEGATDDIYTIADSTNFDGTYKITKVDSTHFKFTATWVDTSGETGTASQEPFVDLTRHKIRFKHASKQAWTPAADDVVEGKTSGAYGTIKAVVVDTGTFAGSDANGTIIFANNSITGTFDEDGEELFERGTGANIVGNSDGEGTDDEFTGDNTNFFWAENWRETLYFTNNNDVIQKYDGSYLTRLHIDLDVEGGPDNDVTRCRLMFAIKNRMVIFDTTESGDGTTRQRARWCDVLDPDTWPNASYKDADTDEWIIAADFIGNKLIVFFERSVWEFAYTGDAVEPFRWDRIDAVEGCYATMSLVSFSDEIFGVGPTKLIGTDGREAYGIDKKIPNLILDWNVDSIGFCYSLVLEEEIQALVSYASAEASAHADGNTYADSALVLNYDDNSFSTYGLPIHVLGYSALESDVTWDLSDAWEDIDWSWDEKSLQSGYPTTLMGSQDGKIYTLNDGGADDGSAIEFQAISSRWNPYIEEGRKARLGWIEFLIDKDSGASFDVKFYLNSESSPYQTEEVACTETGTSRDKVWKRVECGAVGDFHRIEITNNATSNRPRIHAIVPYFEKAGRII